MKTKLLSIVSVLLVILMIAACFAGCSSNDSTGTIPNPGALTEEDGEIAGALEEGNYKLVGIYSKDGKKSKLGKKLLEKLEKEGTSTDLVVNGENVRMMESDYTLKDGKIVNEDNTLTYAVKNGKVTIFDENDGTKTISQK